MFLLHLHLDFKYGAAQSHGVLNSGEVTAESVHKDNVQWNHRVECAPKTSYHQSHWCEIPTQESHRHWTPTHESHGVCCAQQSHGGYEPTQYILKGGSLPLCVQNAGLPDLWALGFWTFLGPIIYFSFIFLPFGMRCLCYACPSIVFQKHMTY